MSIKLDSAAGPLSVTVAEASGADQLVHSILREFVFDVAWYVPPFVAVALLLAAYSVRRSLRPLRAASAQASAIGPASIALRLPETDVPTEALPLVIAVNQALERLEQGFLMQRRFTAGCDSSGVEGDGGPELSPDSSGGIKCFAFIAGRC